jgi:hypothetical protein
VFELFQDLEGFNIEEYRPLANVTAGLGARREFLQVTLPMRGMTLAVCSEAGYHLASPASHLQNAVGIPYSP